MKNVEVLTSSSSHFRIKVEGAPALTGWAVRYLSGMEDSPVSKGFWLAQWHCTDGHADFGFELSRNMSFKTKLEAESVVEALNTNAGIQTEIVEL